jgi:hypothetical protein
MGRSLGQNNGVIATSIGEYVTNPRLDLSVTFSSAPCDYGQCKTIENLIFQHLREI